MDTGKTQGGFLHSYSGCAAASCRHPQVYGFAVFFILASTWLWAQSAGLDLEDQARKSSAAGNYQEAARLYELLTAQQPSSTSAFINLGVAYAKLGRFSLA